MRIDAKKTGKRRELKPTSEHIITKELRLAFEMLPKHSEGP